MTSTRLRRRALAATAVAVALVAAACSSDSGSRAPGSTAGPAGTVASSAPGGTGVGAGTYRATIRRTTDGVPHIVAADLASLSFGQGWASAQDRSCDLADQVVKIKGERAKWLGAGKDDANAKSDFAWKVLGIYERARTELPTKSADVQRLVDGFAAGWSAQLAEVGVDGIAGWCKGAAWVQPLTGLDVYAYARAITLQASSAQVISYIADATPPGEAAPGSTAPTTAAPTTAAPTTAAPTTTTPTTGGTPATKTAATAADRTVATTAGVGPLGLSDPATLGSNGWAIGTERSTDGGGLLLANPHFPWEQELRFYEAQLTIPGELDIYGVQLSGLPGIGIGFTDTFAWTHTVSAGNRFTAYTLDLVPGKPTSYRYDGGTRDMTSTPISIEVAQPDGSTTTTTRTSWSSHYGPIIAFPGVGWTDARTITYRDANIDNDAFFDQYLAMDRAKDLDQFIAAHEQHQGIPLFNTIATSEDGRAWYADTSATPDLSPEAIAAYDASLSTDLIAGTAAKQGAVVLNGSDSRFEWVDEPGARSPGLVPYAKMPKVERRDYVFNANDSFWVPNADHLLAGDYSPLHGRQRTARSVRTRENAAVLRDTSAAGPSGADGTFTQDELATAALQNRGYTPRSLKDAVVARCQGAAPVAVEALPPSSATSDNGLPAGTVDVTQACATLTAWNGTYDLDARGAALWRELMARYDRTAFDDKGALWADPFDATRPVDSPSGLAPAGAGPDPLLVNLARAVQTFDKAGKAVDAPLGELQFADRNGERVPIHGGNAVDGTTNVVGWSSRPGSTTEPIPTRPAAGVTGSSLTPVGYQIDNGSSFMMVVDFGGPGGSPTAKVLLAYGNSQDRANPVFVQSTQSFSGKQWRTVHLGADAVSGQSGLQERTVTG